MKTLGIAWLLLLLTTAYARAASLAIDSLAGPVTANEVNSFITYMQSQTPPPTPWGALNGTGHNAWADGTGGRELEAMGELYQISGNITILNQMVSWADNCTSQRNDLMGATNGGQRVLWTGLIDKVWCPNWPTDSTDNQYLYCGCETEDVIGHLAFCAKLILQNPALWTATVPDGNPFGFGTTYLQRATNYLAKCDEANDEYFLKWFIQPGTSLIVPPTNAAWIAVNENVTAINRQMMFTSGFQRLAEAHEILGDNPARVTQYDAIVSAVVNSCLHGMTNYDRYTVNGLPVYNWGYYPTSTSGTEATEIHAEYDIIGIWRAFNRAKYNLALAPLVPLANTLVNVIYLGTNTFAGNVDGSGGVQKPIYSGWILPADWNPAVYPVAAGVSYTNGTYAGSADIDAGILLMKNRRYLQFSVTPAAGTKTVLPGANTSFSLAVAPLGGFTNSVSLTINGLPAGVTATFNSTSVNLATLNFTATNVLLSITTSNATPVGNYPLTIIGTSGSVSHTNTVNLVVGGFACSASPPAQAVSAGNNVSYTITVTTNSGFSGSVSLGVSGLPANTGASFSPASLSGAGSSTLNVNTASTTPGGTYTLTINGTNGSSVISTTVSLVVAGSNPVWTGGSGSDSNWSDVTNWGGIALTADTPLIFSGSTRLANTNNTAAGTVYSNIVFYPAAGAFVLNGNPITLGGNITNNSASPQTLNFGLKFNGNFTINGASNQLIIGGGLTNTLGASGFTTLTLAGSGQLNNGFNCASSPGGTNIIALYDTGANWSLVYNLASNAITVPWVLNVNAGTFNFGSAASAPVLSSTTPNGGPSDHLVGTESGLTGTLNMINGTLTTAGRLDTATAANATGVINQTGGAFNLGSQFQGANGSNTGEVSIVDLSGGLLNIAGGGGPFYVASRGTGGLTVSDSGTLACGTLDVSRNAYGNTIGSVGTVNLNGGTILASRVGTATANAQTNWQNGSAATFNFNGGTLKINSATAPFFQGSTVAPIIPISAVVQAGGVFIDSNGYTNIFGEPLLHDDSLGSTPDGGLTKNGLGVLILVSNATYTGGTTLNAGTLALSNAVTLNLSAFLAVNAGAMLDASDRIDKTLTLASGQTLTGAGSVKGNTVVGSGATLSPGGSLAMLTFSNNLTLGGGSTTVMELSVSPLTNDVARVAGNLVYGGTLMLTNLRTAPLANGNSFKLFSAAGFSGAFTNLVPVIPGINLAWNTNSLGGGILSVVSSPTPLPTFGALRVDADGINLSGSNGVPSWPYLLLTATNLGLPLTNWTVVATNAFDASGNFSITNPPNPEVTPVFYRLMMP